MKDVSNADLFKLKMLYPGTSFDQDHNENRNLKSMKDECNATLVAHLPTQDFLDVLARERDGQTEYLVLTRLSRDLVASFEADTQEKIVRKVGGRKKSTTLQLQVFRMDENSLKLEIYQTIDLPNIVPYFTDVDKVGTQIAHHYLLQGPKSEVLIFSHNKDAAESQVLDQSESKADQSLNVSILARDSEDFENYPVDPKS